MVDGSRLLGGAALLLHHPEAALRMLLGGLALWGFYRLLHAIQPNGTGYGDVRLGGLIGLYLAWINWGALVTGAVLGVLVAGIGAAAVLVARRRGLKAEIPYGPYMLAGAWLGILWGQPLASAYLRASGA